jgi:ELWxxDGT repeat protein
VLDVNSTPAPLSSEPRALGRLGSVELFQATLAIPEMPRTALVKSDGTAAGTVTLKVFQGKGPQRVTVIGARAFFVAEETATGNQVWVTDGTADGTRQITRFAQPTTNPPTPSPTPFLLAAFGNDLLFARDSGSGLVLYRTDGTPTGTVDLGPIVPTSGAPVKFDVVTVGNRIYFISLANNIGELWVSDGTKAGTQKIPTTSTPNIRELRAVNGGVVFTSNAGLARVDPGTNAITILNVFPSVATPGTPGSSTLVEMNGYLYFAGTQSAPNDLELWRSDGTPGGTTLVKNINASASSFQYPMTDVVKVGDRVIFAANDGGGDRLWSSDGTDAGTTAIYNSGVQFSFGLGDAILPAIETVRARYISAYIGSTSVTIMTDGTAAGTMLMAPTIAGDRANLVDATGDANADYQLFATQNQTTGATATYAFKFTPPNQYSTVRTSPDAFGITSFVLIGDRLIFDAWDDIAGQELWVSDSAGTRQLVDLTPNAYTGHSNAQWLTDWNGKLAFSAEDGAHGAELWISDGTAAGTKLLADINPGAASSTPRQLYVWNGALYFFANNGSYRLMRLTSPDATPEVLATIDPPPRYDSGGAIETLRCLSPTPAAMGNKLFFAAKDATHGTELWSTDGTAAGTAMIADLNLNVSGITPVGSMPCFLTPFKNRLYFTADAIGTGQPTDGTALWSTDGTSAGTTRFSTTGAGGLLLVYNNELYFRAVDTSTSTIRTWKTADGTQAGATLVGDVGSAYGAVNGNVMFLLTTVSGSPATVSYQIWATNSAGTTTLISDSMGGFTVLPTRIYFSKNVSGTNEIWSSDGTPAGTQRVKILGPATVASPYWVVDFRGITLLITLDSDGRRRVWRTDGTEAGTKEIGATAARSTTGAVLGPVVSGQNVFYAGLDVTGNELYAIPNDAPTAAADSATATGGQPVTVSVLANDFDPDGTIDASTVLPVQPPAHGSVLLNANGTITYTPASGYSGSDSFTYRVADNQGNTSTGTVTLTVTASGSGGNNGGGGGSGGEGGGGGGAMRWLDLLALAALLSLPFVRNARPGAWRGKNLSPAVNNL